MRYQGGRPDLPLVFNVVPKPLVSEGLGTLVVVPVTLIFSHLFIHSINVKLLVSFTGKFILLSVTHLFKS